MHTGAIKKGAHIEAGIPGNYWARFCPHGFIQVDVTHAKRLAATLCIDAGVGEVPGVGDGTGALERANSSVLPVSS